jgi:hypothetical protein
MLDLMHDYMHKYTITCDERMRMLGVRTCVCARARTHVNMHCLLVSSTHEEQLWDIWCRLVEIGKRMRGL